MIPSHSEIRVKSIQIAVAATCVLHFMPPLHDGASMSQMNIHRVFM